MGRAESFTLEARQQPVEEENLHLREAVSALRAAVRAERAQREGVERECNLLVAEFSRLQTRVQVRPEPQQRGVAERCDVMTRTMEGLRRRPTVCAYGRGSAQAGPESRSNRSSPGPGPLRVLQV